MTTAPFPANLDDKLTTIAHSERLMRAEVLVKNYTLASAALSLVPLPLVDLLALMALEVKMVHDLCKHYDVSFKANLVRALLSSVLFGLTGGLLTKGLYSLARAVPVLGTLGGAGGFAVSCASVTYAAGTVFIKHFEANGTLLTIDSEWFKKMFKSELDKDPAESVIDATTVATAAG